MSDIEPTSPLLLDESALGPIESDPPSDGVAGNAGHRRGHSAGRRPAGPRQSGVARSRPNWLGILGATLAFGAAITPSLLPRPWLMEGAICGIGAAIGYGIGVCFSWLIRRVVRREPGQAVKRWAWYSLLVVAPILAVYWLLVGVGWQNEVRRLVGMSDEGLLTALKVAAVTIVIFPLCIWVGRVLRRFAARVIRLLDKVMPRRIAAVAGVVVVGVVIYFAVTGILLNGFIALMNRVYAGTNASTAPGIAQPQEPERSGSPQSLAPWNTLGVQGRSFVGRGPSVTDLTTFSGRPAMEPIRVYVGLGTASTAADRAALAVKELERTGAFSRAVLVVAGTTGTGWLEPQTVDSIEYEWNGDSAIVGIQYSYLPSWISTLVDAQKASDAGTALFKAVYAQWSTLPVTSRPKLIAYGLSLGSFSMQSGFTSASDLAARTDGAIFVGSPSFSQPWGRITAGRAPGSPEWRPVYGNGANVRFAGTPSDLASPAGPWSTPRTVYLQHANDPVVWWSPNLLFREPDWLREPPGPGRTPTMRYYPILTFLQVTVDQFVGVSVPNGQGHNYATAMPAVLAAVTSPPNWTDADTARLKSIIDSIPIE